MLSLSLRASRFALTSPRATAAHSIVLGSLGSVAKSGVSRPQRLVPRLHCRRSIATMSAASADTGVPATGTEAKLPPLSAKDYRVYNSMADHMDMFHNHFRHTWNMLHGACAANQRPAGMSMRQFLNTAAQFCSQLNLHHNIEEQHIFPVLARKMVEFRAELELLTHHKRIHAGLEVMEAYVDECRSGQTELRLGELKVKMDAFGAVLWEHLDAEVKALGAENMRKYWTLDEMRRMPM